MANPILPIPQFPDVPIALGVPPVLRDAANSAIAEANSAISGLLTSDAPGVADTSTDPQWGLFDSSGNAVITADSVFGFEIKKTWKIPTYPQEEGAFQSYNKVELPSEPRIVFMQGGSISDRTDFLNQVVTICASLSLYAAYTPEMQWPSVNPVGYSVMNRTSEKGATLISVEVQLEEVRVTASQQFTSSPSPATPASATNTATPSGNANTNTGPVQPQTPTPTQSAAVSSSAAQQTLVTV